MNIRYGEIDRKIDPINTRKPWNPVAVKNIEPQILSLKQKNEFKYSIV